MFPMPAPALRAYPQSSSSSSSFAAGAVRDGIRFVIAKKDRLALDQISEAAAAAHAAADIDRCQTGAAALAALHDHSAYLGVFGLSLPDMDGLDLIARVVAERLVFRILVVSSRRDERARHLLRPGRIDGFCDPEREGFAGLVEAIRTVAGGGTWFNRGVAAAVEAAPRSAALRLDQMLSPHQQRIFALIGGGCDDHETGKILRLSHHTAHGHRQIIMRKLGVHTCEELMREAIRRGVVRHTPNGVLRPGFDHELWPEARPSEDASRVA